MNNLASIASYCNFVSILETMLDNLECILNDKLDKNNKLIYFFSKCFT